MEINNVIKKSEEYNMISNEHLHEEYQKIEDILKKIEAGKATKEEIAWATIKSTLLSAKLTHNLRTNSVAIMKKYGIELKKPIKKEGEGTVAE
jgi:hypothetical protein